MKNKNTFLVISALLLIPLLATTALADGELTATRVISDYTVEPGDIFTVTLTLDAIDDVQAPALDEDHPASWNVRQVDNYFGTFKENTTEWIWSMKLLSENSLIIIYNVTVPADAVPGVYDITGVVSAHGFGPYVTEGDNNVTIPPVETPTPEPTATPEPTEIPEFPMIAIPLISILGMMFLLSRKN